MVLSSITGVSCAKPSHAAAELPKPEKDLTATTQPSTATAVFAGGCFWCTEAVYENLKGVRDVISGYAGGTKETADYETVSSGATGHAEAIKITYDPSIISYGQLLRVFFTVVDPTTLDQQGPDGGHQYRSAIFYENDEQKAVAESYIRQLTEAKAFSKPIVTTIEKLDAFHPAENYHQDFVAHHLDHPYVKAWALPKLKKLQEHFPDQVTTQPSGKK